MRHIKFRAWGRINKHMYPAAFPSWNGCVEGKIDLIGHHVEEIEQGGDDTPVLMQATGFLDRNGKEIYEGDVLKREHGTAMAGPVYFDGDLGSFEVSMYAALRDLAPKCVVIGNIWEHPELLEAK